jgi:hypothetical protein
MDPRNTERPPMVHKETPSANSSRDYSRRPMVSKKESFTHKAAVLLAKIGLGATVAVGGAGAVHHVTGVELGGPIPVGAVSDTIQSGAMDQLVKLSISSGPQQEQKDLNQEIAATNELFKPNFARKGGQIEIDLANLSESRTKEILLAIRLGNDYEKIDPSKVTTVDGLSAEPGARFAVDDPTVVDLTAQGLGIYYTGSIKTDQGLTEPVLIPESSIKLTVPGILEPISKITESDKLDVAHKISPTP